MAIAYHWESMPFKSIDCGPVKTVQLIDLPHGEMIAEELQVDLDCEVDLTSWITCFGTEELSPGLLVCTDKEDDLPVFSQIKDIIAFNGEYFLVTEDFQTLCFAEHFHSFHVTQGNDQNVHVTQGNDQNVSMLKVDKLHFFKPFDLQTTYGFDRDDQYVVPVHVLV